jgi:hypothetical protein
MWVGFALTLAWACALVGIGWVLRSHGAIGLSVTYLVAYLVHLILAVGCAHLLVQRGAAIAVPGG